MATPRKAAVLTAEQILEADDLKTQEVDVPEWGGKVVVRPLKKGEWDKAEAMTNEVEGNNYLLLCGLVEPELSKEQVEKLAEKNLLAVQRISDGIIRATGIGSLESAEKSFLAGASD